MWLASESGDIHMQHCLAWIAWVSKLNFGFKVWFAEVGWGKLSIGRMWPEPWIVTSPLCQYSLLLMTNYLLRAELRLPVISICLCCSWFVVQRTRWPQYHRTIPRKPRDQQGLPSNKSLRYSSCTYPTLLVHLYIPKRWPGISWIHWRCCPSDGQQDTGTGKTWLDQSWQTFATMGQDPWYTIWQPESPVSHLHPHVSPHHGPYFKVRLHKHIQNIT